MREHKPVHIEGARKYFEQQGFHVEAARIGDIDVSYWVLPQSLEPRLTDFAYRMTATDPLTQEVSGIFGVSDSVPAELRPYWALHEIVEFTQIGINQPGRCAEAEEVVVGLVPNELKHAFVERRATFFYNLADYFRADLKNYTKGDIHEVEAAFEYLHRVQETMTTRSTSFEGEYRVLREIMNMTNPVIKYPASGSDVSLFYVFPESDTYYIDTDASEIEKIKGAGLPKETTYLITESAYTYNVPEKIDLVVLRNPSTDSHDIIGLTRGLRNGGYVIESHWGSTFGSQELLAHPDFFLVGVMKQIDGQKDVYILDTDTKRIETELESDVDVISEYAGRGYVFQKRDPMVVKD